MRVSRDDALISIIMPLFNSDRFVEETLESVLAQTYGKWELVVVDDCSTDSSYEKVEAFSRRVGRGRVHLYSLAVNQGAAKARQVALSHVKGDYVAYLDSDDVWLPRKLERQLEFMKGDGAAMCFTGYETIEEDGAYRNVVHVPERMHYRDFLKQTITCSHTIMFDLKRVPLDLLSEVRDVTYDYPEDLDTWLRVLKTGIEAKGIDEPLAKYRRHDGSRSSSKAKAVARTWNQYTRNEELNPLYSAYCLFWQLTHAVLKRV
jgi:teichuronic acid biosynthesis glycosyltransferase TuaG